MTAAARVDAAYERMAGVDRPDLWTAVVDRDVALATARTIDQRVLDGEPLALAGTVVAVKDNIDLAGWLTTAACPAFAYEPATTAPAVQRLLDAGAIVVGKTNLDQFATGLVGTRSPAFGTVANARIPDRIAGGSSSGSAVAVALGIVDVALGTDTAGSGRVPAAANGVVGLKPTHGLVSTRGVVPASPSFDCVSVFAPTIIQAAATMDVLVGRDPDDPRTRPDGVARQSIGNEVRRVGIPGPAGLGLAAAETKAFEAAVERIGALGWTAVPVGTELIEEAGRMLYGSALLAERHASVGAFLASHPGEVDPIVAEVVARGAGLTADAYLEAWTRLLDLRVAYARATSVVDVVMVPTMPFLPTVAEVAADPIGVNAALGRFASAGNLLDLCGAAVPAGLTSDGLPFGVTFLGPALADHIVVAAGAEFLGEAGALATVEPAGPAASSPPVLLAVAGLHLSGQPLNHQLTDRGARLVATTCTAPLYRLLRLDTDPAKPGLVRDDTHGAAIEVEVWELPAVQFADFVALVRPPLAIGALDLLDGSTVAGFVALPDGLPGAIDITSTGSWRIATAAQP